MAVTTSGGMMLPDRYVNVPLALISGQTPSWW
jgi:hypothetical protein